MAPLSRVALVVLPTLVVAAIGFVGSSRSISEQSQPNQSGADQGEASLLELLEEPQAAERASWSTASSRASSPSSSPAAGPDGGVAPLVPDVPPLGESVSLPIRVALTSRSPIRSLQTSQGMVCRVPGAGPRLKDRDLLSILRSDRAGSVRCSGGTILINQVPYRHTLEFLRRDQGWIAVNELDLEQYVASVVGAEMPSDWNLEALKAQAVAARSYALAHLARPASRDFNLGDTTRWQVYGGEATRSQRSRDATASTRGIVLSYKGGIVESLYAATSSISAEAHGHLGASMSQQGAQQLALDGLQFNEILGHYYRGASLARLQRDGG